MKKQLRFLVLEDSASDAELLIEELKKSTLNFIFKVVDDKKPFRLQINKFKPDLIFSDYSLPTITGMEAIQIVQAECPHIPVIIVTGSVNEETAVACMKAGAVDYVLKDKLKRLVPATLIALKNQRLKNENLEIQERLKSTEENLRLSMHGAAIGMVILSTSGKFLSTNTAFEEMLGYPEKELLSKSFQDITYPDDFHIGRQLVQKIIRGEKTSGVIEKRYIRKDGQVIWVRLHTALIRDATGNPSHLFTQAENITQQKQSVIELERAKLEIQSLQEIFSRVIENADGVPYVLNYETNTYEFIGAGIEALLEVKPEQLTPEKMHHILAETVIMDHNFNKGSDPKNYTKAFRTSSHNKFRADFRVRLDSGTEKWISDKAINIRNDQNQSTHSWGILMDITKRKKIELDLAGKERYYRALLNQLHEEMVVIDRNYKITDVNRSYLISSGKERGEVIGKHCFSTSHSYNQPCDLEGEKCALKEVFRSGKSSTCLHEHVQQDGSKEWVDIRLSPVKDEHGEITQVIESARNVSDLIRAQEELLKLSQAIEQSPVSVVLTNLEGNIEYVNPKFCEISGYSREEALGKNPRILKSGEHDQSFYREMWDTISKGNIWQGAFHNRRKDGQLYWEEATISPVRANQDCITHYIGLKEDITKQKKLELQLQQSQKLEAVGQLAGGVAHDFNNLLTIINGYSELILARLDETDPLRKDVQQIAHAGERAGGLTQQLLAFSRKQVIKPKIMDLNLLVAETEKMLRRLIGEDVELISNLQENLWPVKADSGQIDQILLNLSVNARDAMPRGGKLVIETKNVTIDGDYYKNETEAVPGNYSMLTITDTGSGMDPETQKHIFEPFFTTKEQGSGTGLGLATVYGIVKQNGGYIWVYSEPHIGTTFKIYLPAVEVVKEFEEREKLETSHLGGSETILVVEDESDVRRLTREILDQNGYTVMEAGNGNDALALLKKNKNRIHLLISDVIMPEMGGKKFRDELQKHAPQLRIIFVSGYTNDVISRSGILEEAVQFLQKPFTPLDLLKIVRETLDMK